MPNTVCAVDRPRTRYLLRGVIVVAREIEHQPHRITRSRYRRVTVCILKEHLLAQHLGLGDVESALFAVAVEGFEQGLKPTDAARRPGGLTDTPDPAWRDQHGF